MDGGSRRPFLAETRIHAVASRLVSTACQFPCYWSLAKQSGAKPAGYERQAADPGPVPRGPPTLPELSTMVFTNATSHPDIFATRAFMLAHLLCKTKGETLSLKVERGEHWARRPRGGSSEAHLLVSISPTTLPNARMQTVKKKQAIAALASYWLSQGPTWLQMLLRIEFFSFNGFPPFFEALQIIFFGISCSHNSGKYFSKLLHIPKQGYSS